MMPKSDTIEAIMQLNPTARPTFLAEFSNSELGDYLRRLARATESRKARVHARAEDLNCRQSVAVR
jgi:hypothetical protein